MWNPDPATLVCSGEVIMIASTIDTLILHIDYQYKWICWTDNIMFVFLSQYHSLWTTILCQWDKCGAIQQHHSVFRDILSVSARGKDDIGMWWRWEVESWPFTSDMHKHNSRYEASLFRIGSSSAYTKSYMILEYLAIQVFVCFVCLCFLFVCLFLFFLHVIWQEHYLVWHPGNSLPIPMNVKCCYNYQVHDRTCHHLAFIPTCP